MPVQGQNGPWNFLFPHASLTNPDSPQAEAKAHEPRGEYRQVKAAVACALYAKAGAPPIHFTLITIGDNESVVPQISIMGSPGSDARAWL
jgi:hypothetical protein